VPWVVIAHSCGNWVAYELLKRLRGEGLPMPHMAFLSCMAAPSIAEQAKVRLTGGKDDKHIDGQQERIQCPVFGGLLLFRRYLALALS
jgi:surfactin synthase thioesterase subunit